CPSFYDLRNIFQVNVEEVRHLWAMVYLLHRYFGRDGREEAEALLARRSGDTDNPRILGAFNEPTPDWLAFYMFTFFTDRDGKFQLCALAESGFDPLARTCRFMLTEEAHHMFVGETGMSRIIQRTCVVMKEHKVEDPKDVTALNERLRDDYIEEIADGVGRWQRVIDNAGIPFRLTLPHKGFHREIGNFTGHFINPDGEVLSEEAWRNHEFAWLPNAKDYA